MITLLNRLRIIAGNPLFKWVAAPAMVVAVVGSVIGGPSPLPTIDLAAEPLYARGAKAKPTLSLVLSVEFPTVGAQYLGTTGGLDDTYNPETEYIGYFDIASCYSYVDNPTETRPTGVPVDDYKRFDRVGPATLTTRIDSTVNPPVTYVRRECNTGGNEGFAGNFMNWAASSAVDILRLGLSGGDRIVDTVVDTRDPTLGGLTVLQRAVLRKDFWNSGNFPAKQLKAALAVGAVPRLLRRTTTGADFTGDIFIANCLNRINFGTTRAGNCDVPGANGDLGKVVKGANGVTEGITNDVFMYSRVRVCESNATGLRDPRTSYCLQYPNGSFKPIGNLQKYSDDLRVSAFGYLNDSTGNPKERYGGVLRVPMKYVGPTAYDQNFAPLAGVNPNKEWNETTGELIANPDGLLGETKSGIINYLNQFGRSGNYKVYDPVGELYYEALRYLQGLPPTDAATSGVITTDMKDGFPYYTSWIDPHPPVSGMTDYSCVKNNIVGIGDVNTHNDKYIPGNDRAPNANDAVRPANSTGDPSTKYGPAGNEPDFKKWTSIVGAFEAGLNVSYFDGLGNPQTTSNPKVIYGGLKDMATRDIGADHAAYYIAGMAYWANTHDIRGKDWTAVDKQRPGMRVKTYFLDVNEYGAQTNPNNHQQNQFFLAAKYGGFDDVTSTGNPFLTLSKSTIINGNDNWEAAPVGSNEARNYYLSSSAGAVLRGLDAIFKAAAQGAKSIAGASISAQTVTTTDSYIYQSQFDSIDWTGDVTATSVSAAASGGNASVGTSKTAPWTSVADVLAKKGTSNRKIYVGGGSSVAAAVSFEWAKVPKYVQLALQTPVGSTSATDTATVGGQRLDYLRGDQTLEAPRGTFRTRTRLLGDIVNSAVVYSGGVSTTKKTLFVGANDGMLHAFDAANGEELFGYIPSWVVPKLSALTSPAYVHQSYVDASPVVADAKVGGVMKTVLVSGSGGGGQGVFAIDVSNPDPSGFDESKVMWEFSDADDVDIGNVIGKPRILSLNTSASGLPKSFAVFASGVNNYAPDGRASSTAQNALFFLDLSKPANSPWVQGANYFKIVFPKPTSTAIANGMANFAVRGDTQGQVTTIYAGDLQGNMWKLDLKRAILGAADWTMDNLSAFADTSGARTAKPFFIAKDDAASLQPITMEPTLLYGPNNGVVPNDSLVVTFGTGKFLEVSDVTGGYKTQSVYAVMDDGTNTLDVPNTPVGIAGRGRLQKGSAASGVVTVAPFVYGKPTTDSSSVALPTELRAGWFFDFPGSSSTGERQVSDFAVVPGSAIDGSTLAFGSVIPSLNSCANGSGNLYFMKGLRGGGSFLVSTDGIFGPPIVVPVADSSLGLTGSDSIGRRVLTTRYGLLAPKSSANPGYFDMGTTVQNAGRMSWREINNLRP